MTTVPARRDQTQAAAASSPRLPGLLNDELPTALVEARKVKGFRHEVWTSRALVAADRPAVENALAVFEQRLVPSEGARILWHVGRLANQWKNTRSEAENDLFFDDWAEDLAPYSEAHIAEACGEWRRAEYRFPKIAEIIAILDHKVWSDKEMRRRARVLLGLQEPRPWEREEATHAQQPMSDGRREEILRDLAKTDPVLAASARKILEANKTDHPRSDRD